MFFALFFAHPHYLFSFSTYQAVSMALSMIGVLSIFRLLSGQPQGAIQGLCWGSTGSAAINAALNYVIACSHFLCFHWSTKISICTACYGAGLHLGLSINEGD